MAIPPRGKLTLLDLSDGRFFLHGYIKAKNAAGIFERTHIRERSRDGAALTIRKLTLETEAEAYEKGLVHALKPMQTRLTEEQNRDAEEAVRKLMAGRTLVFCVETVNKLLGDGAPVLCSLAHEAWETEMNQRSREKATITDNMGRVRRFLESAKPKCLQDITPKMIKDWAQRKGVASLSQVGDAKVVKAWLNFCVKEKYLVKSPFEIDMKRLKQDAEPENDPGILTPEKAQRLLHAAYWERLDSDTEQGMGEMGPFVILALWCFLRPSEVRRLGPSNLIVRDGKIIIHLRGKKRGSQWREPEVPANVAPLLLRYIEAGAIKAHQKDEKGKVVEKGGAFYSERLWKRIRARAGLLQLVPAPAGSTAMPTIKEGSSQWGADILRHTGMSFLFQKLRADGGKSMDDAADEVTSQAGNSKRILFKHYLSPLPEDSFKVFYSVAIVPSDRNAPRAEVIDIKTAVA